MPRFEEKPAHFMGSSLKALRALPKVVRGVFGYAIDQAQLGETHPQAKRLKGREFRGVVEVIEDDDGSTYRAFYTVRFKNAVYVLHCFQKKSKKGIATPKSDLDLVLWRLHEAELHSKAEEK